jgi:hypothetical protein
MNATGAARSARSWLSVWPEFLLSCGIEIPSRASIASSIEAQSAHCGGQL